MDFRESFFKITLLSSSSLYSLSIQRFSTFKLQINPPFLSPPVEIRYLRCLYVVGSYRSAQCFKKACKLLSTKPRASPQYLSSSFKWVLCVFHLFSFLWFSLNGSLMELFGLKIFSLRSLTSSWHVHIFHGEIHSLA